MAGDEEEGADKPKADEKIGGGAAEETSLRASSKSISMYGPPTSQRTGRPDHLQSAVEKRQSQVDMLLGDADVEALQAVAEAEEQGEEGKAQRRRSSVIPIPTDTKEELLRLDDEAQRTLLQKLHQREPKQLVQVTLENVSYHIPVQLDKPTKQTVVNQSLCYFTYEFFQRLGNLMCPPKDEGLTRKKYIIKQYSDLFVPFTKKTVLHNVSLVLQPGKTYLVLGPPGGGKTTLLQAIAGRLPHHLDATGQPYKKKPHVTGRVAYNDVSTDEDPSLVLANIASFVGQLDVHAPLMTVKETFDFASDCREDIKEAGRDEEKKEDVSAEAKESENLTIAGLGLAHVQDTFVGNTNVRGVSGGQRRRVTIGEMMQGDCLVACCDEISTGLDAAVTYDICESIVNYSKAVKTTRIVSLLQPGPETFALFDEVIVLAEGHVAYAGPVPEVVDYFESLGYPLPATMDVADFLCSVTTNDGLLLFDKDRSLYDKHLTSDEFGKAFSESRQGRKIQELLKEPSPYSWAKAKVDSDNEGSSTLGAMIPTSLKSGTVETTVPPKFKNEFQHSWLQSFRLNFRRGLLLWRRDKAFIIGKTFENIGMAMATGGILFGRAVIPDSLKNLTEWNQQTAQDLQTIQDGVNGALFMTCLHMLLGTTTSTPDEVDDRPIHYKQADANFYHTTAFVFARLAASLPMRAIEMLAFGIPVYWMVGLDASAQSFLLYLLIVLTYTFSLKILYSIIAQILPNKQNVLSFGTFLVLLFALFGGFIVYPDTIPGYYQWLYWSNPMAWAFQALLLTEFRSTKYTDDALGNALSLSMLSSRGFQTERAFIGYTFVFFFPYMFVCACVLSFVLKKVRLEPIRSNPQEASVVDEDDGPKEFSLPFVPVDLTFEEVSYEVKASTGDETIRILNGVSGVLRPGRMCALMGSSGAGKTTLMDVVALRKTSGTITGDVRMNGFPQERTSFLRSSGYVEQFDVQQAEITVRETVEFSAQLRLSRDNPVTATTKGRMQFVDYCLEMMELTDIERLPVGSYEEGGLTFEQRKRLAIAVELAASPSIIFLDEPTSGLDARGALVIMRAMKRIADTNRTVCATIHQPSAAVFEMFNDLLLLKRGGEVVFFGDLGTESCNLVKYFEERGADPIEHGENPAAWMLRAYTHEDDDTDWKELFEQSEQYRVMKDDLVAIKESPDADKKIEYDHVYAASRRLQMSLMIKRCFLIMARAPSYNLARIMIAIVYAAILGTVFVRTRSSSNIFSQNEVDGVVSTIFLSLIITGVVSVSMSVPVMKQIRDVFYKHRASGMLDHNSVTVGVTLAEIPWLAIMSALFSAVFYSLVGLFESTNKWFWFFFIFGLNMATYTYFGQAFICLVRDTNTAGALVGALIGFNVFFSGLVVRPQYFVGPFLLGYWTAPGRFAYEAMIVTQFIGLNYTVVADPGTPYFFSLGCTDLNQTCEGTMDYYVGFFFGGKFTDAHLPIDIAVLFFCLLLARFGCWLALWKLNYVNT